MIDAIVKSFFEANTKAAMLSIWKGILGARETIWRGEWFVIADGKKVNLWKDPWILWNEDFKPKASSEWHLQPYASFKANIAKQQRLG